MRSIEAEGDTIDEAIDSALRALAVDRDQVELQILSDATRGLFGFGGSKARVRATIRASVAARFQDGTSEGTVSRESTARETADRASRCRILAEELVGLMGLTCEVRVRDGNEQGELVVEISGDSGGLLIGRRGQTLDALEYLLNRMMGLQHEAGRIAVDVEGYRIRRQDYLDALAHRLADKARESGRSVALNPMSPRDRRIVHLALQPDEGVETRSEGEGYYRRLVIIPARRPPAR